jgi:hypothetical protein
MTQIWVSELVFSISFAHLPRGAPPSFRLAPTRSEVCL